MSDEDERTQAIKHGLGVAGSVRRKFFSEAGDADDRSYPVLSGVVQEVEGGDAWLADSHAAFRRALRKAIAKLDERFPQGKGDYAGCEKRRVAELLFGYRKHEMVLSADKMPLTGRKQEEFGPGDYRNAAREALRPELEERTYERAFATIRLDLARILQDMAKEATARRLSLQVESAIGSEDDSFHLERREYDRAIEALALSPIVALVGESGVGKTVLARRIVEDAQSIFVPVHSTGVMLRTLRKVLGPESRGYDAAALMFRFYELLETDQNLNYVVIDGLVDWDLLDDLLPPSPLPKVIITARAKLATRPCTYVSVGDLSRDQACTLAAHYLPDATDEETTLIADRLRGRARAIVQSCLYIRKNPSLRTAFIEALFVHDTEALVSAAGGIGEQALISSYQAAIDQLRDPATAHAIRLLEFYVCLYGNQWLPTADLNFVASYGDANLGLSSYVSAKSILERHGLVRLVPRDIKEIDESLTSSGTGDIDFEATFGEAMVSHPVTLSFLHEILFPEGMSGFARLASYFKHKTAEEKIELAEQLEASYMRRSLAWAKFLTDAIETSPEAMDNYFEGLWE